jgi:hypothetical protein
MTVVSNSQGRSLPAQPLESLTFLFHIEGKIVLFKRQGLSVQIMHGKTYWLDEKSFITLSAH